jgi:hypothetical protein
LIAVLVVSKHPIIGALIHGLEKLIFIREVDIISEIQERPRVDPIIGERICERVVPVVDRGSEEVEEGGGPGAESLRQGGLADQERSGKGGSAWYVTLSVVGSEEDIQLRIYDVHDVFCDVDDGLDGQARVSQQPLEVVTIAFASEAPVLRGVGRVSAVVYRFLAKGRASTASGVWRAARIGVSRCVWNSSRSWSARPTRSAVSPISANTAGLSAWAVKPANNISSLLFRRDRE